MLFDVRVIKIVGVCLLTFFLLTSVTLHYILTEMMVMDGSNNEENINLLTNSNDWRHVLIGVLQVGGGSSSSSSSLSRRERMKSVFRSASNKRQGGGDESAGGGGGGSGAGQSSSRKKKSTTRRERFEERYPPTDLDRIRKAVAGLRQPMPSIAATAINSMPYDPFHCPAVPPPGYPMEWNLVSILKAWNPDDTVVPSSAAKTTGGIHQGLCVFDSDQPNDLRKAQTYRKAEVPFVLQNQPDVLRASERWNSDSNSSSSYLEKLVGPAPQRNEHSQNNHFMFWRSKHKKHKNGGNHHNNNRNHDVPDDWKPPTENVKLSFGEWYERARELERSAAAAADQNKRQQQQLLVDREHWYFRLNAEYRQLNDYMYDELPFFVPDPDHPTLFMVEPEAQRGINCRFGMRGVIAESHFDSSRNWIVVMGGQRRYILSHPSQCRNMELYPVWHPSGRHSRVDWSHPELYDGSSAADGSDGGDRPFAHATANEVVLQAGDALYLPTYWFHFIVSLNINYQCNARSGASNENDHFIDHCGLGGMV